MTFRRSLYIAGGVGVLALTGIFTTFQSVTVISGTPLTLSLLLLLVALLGTGTYAASQSREFGLGAMVINGGIGGLVVSAVLTLLYTVIYNDVGNVREGIRFVFPNLGAGMYELLRFGFAPIVGLIILLFLGLVLGGVTGPLLLIPARYRNPVLIAIGLTVTVGLLEQQVIEIIILGDALALVGALAAGYVVGRFVGQYNPPLRAIIGAVLGVGVALITAAFTPAVVPDGAIILALPIGQLLLTLGLAGVLGALLTGAPRGLHNGVLFAGAALLIFGIVNIRDSVDVITALITLIIVLGVTFLEPRLSREAADRYGAVSNGPQRFTQGSVGVLAFAAVMIAPMFFGQSITFTLGQVAIFIILGLGLNIVVGYAGLLDLGHVGFFAIGAYTIGLLTTPGLITCGVPAPDVTQDMIAGCNLFPFWMALPIAVGAAALAGVILGIPVLRLRGDYLAIVTLGLAEIIGRLIASSDLAPVFGAAQGINAIPSPVIDLSFINEAWVFRFFSDGIYYLAVPGVLLLSLVTVRLVESRVGRAWRSMKADEDVAQAMGVHLVRYKLTAFGISAAFAGLGGALFGAGLGGAFPNSFTLLVSINVLSMIIIGGLGSIPGVILGALMLYGLPEVLRELRDYRLLVFGMLLVITMLLKPDGLLPPPVRQMTQQGRRMLDRVTGD